MGTRAAGGASTGTRRLDRRGHRQSVDHRRGRVAGQRSRQSGGIGAGGGQRSEYRLGGGGSHGYAAYGDGGTRQTFADAGRRLVAKVPGRPNRKHFPKNDFHLDLAAGSCTCPAGQVTHAIVPAGCGLVAPVVSTDCRPSSTGRFMFRYVHCAPRRSRPKAGSRRVLIASPGSPVATGPGPAAKRAYD